MKVTAKGRGVGFLHRGKSQTHFNFFFIYLGAAQLKLAPCRKMIGGVRVCIGDILMLKKYLCKTTMLNNYRKKTKK